MPFKKGNFFFILLILELFLFGCGWKKTLQKPQGSQSLQYFWRQIEEQKRERNYSAVIGLLEEAPIKFPLSSIDQKRVFVEKMATYLSVQNYEKVSEEVSVFLNNNPNCWICYYYSWKNAFESGERGNLTKDYSEKIQKEIHFLEEKREKILQANPDEKSEYFVALQKGYTILGDQKNLGLLKKLILQNSKNTLAHQNIADEDYREILRRNPNVSRSEFVENYPDHEDVEMIYQMELRARLNLAQKNRKDNFARVNVLKWTKNWRKNFPRSWKAYYFSASSLKELGIKTPRIRRYLLKSIRLIDRYGVEKREPLYTPQVWQEQLRENQALIRSHLAWLDIEKHKYIEAQKTLKGIEPFLPNHANVCFQRGVVEEALGNLKEAEHFYLQSLVLGYSQGQVLNPLKEIRKIPDLTLQDLRLENQKQNNFPGFFDITEELGLAQVKGSWVSWGDYDGDGDEDLLIGGGKAPGLYKNQKIGGKIVFENVIAEVFPQTVQEFQHGIFADVDRDGDLDLWLSNPNRLLVNSKGTFRDRTQEFFPDIKFRPSSPSSASAWGDFDGDGWLDLYVANYESPGNPIGKGNRDFLFHNQKGKRFLEVCARVGCAEWPPKSTGEPMCGRGVTWGDFDNDGDSDLYVSNYRLDPNYLYVNQGNGTLRDEAGIRKVRGHQVAGNFGHSIGSEFGDMDNDGDLDLITCNLAHPRALAYSDKTQIFRNEFPHRLFVDTFSSSGIFYEETHSDPSLGDLDHDGDLDLILTATYPGKFLSVYQNKGDGTFQNVTFASGIEMENSWGSALADFDQDGDLDLVVASTDGVRVFQNELEKSEHLKNKWIHVRPVDSRTGTLMMGARVTVFNSSGKRQIRGVQGGKGTGNQHSLAVEFGLGEDAGPVTVLVRFPNGKVVLKDHVRPNQVLTVSNRGTN